MIALIITILSIFILYVLYIYIIFIVKLKLSYKKILLVINVKLFKKSFRIDKEIRYSLLLKKVFRKRNRKKKIKISYSKFINLFAIRNIMFYFENYNNINLLVLELKVVGKYGKY